MPRRDRRSPRRRLRLAAPRPLSASSSRALPGRSERDRAKGASSGSPSTKKVGVACTPARLAPATSASTRSPKAVLAKRRLGLVFVQLEPPCRREQVLLREPFAPGEQQGMRLPELSANRGELGELRREIGSEDEARRRESASRQGEGHRSDRGGTSPAGWRRSRTDTQSLRIRSGSAGAPRSR